MDTAKHDMTLTYEGRTFAVRAYRDGSDPAGADWHVIILDGRRTPLRHELGASRSPADCFAEAVRFLTARVDGQAVAVPGVGVPHAAPAALTSPGVDGWEAEGGAIARDRDRARRVRPLP